MSGAGYDPVGQSWDAGGRVEPPPAVRELLRAGVLASDARLVTRDGRWQVEGDPTEGALVVAAAKVGLDPVDLSDQEPRIAEIPFTSERRRMTTLHAHGHGHDGLLEGGSRAGIGRLRHPAEIRPRGPAHRRRSRVDSWRRATDGWRRPSGARHRAGNRRASVEDAEHAHDAARPRCDDGSPRDRSAGAPWRSARPPASRR